MTDNYNSSSIISRYTTEELLGEPERRNFKVAIKVIGVDVECRIGDREFEVRAI